MVFQHWLDRAVAEFGHIDILVNNAGLIRREDALEFSEKDWDDVMNLNIKSVFFMSQAAAKTLYRARQWRQDYSISRQCSPSRAGSVCLLIPHQKAV
ncbi:2-deoxy-D-gluconate 3-dehydrogenase, N-ter fragment [Escherichia coli]|uniref:2-deoxy-D-gluconate 3-dehydrogenase, N-ter n=1 Tax=Escherichia coli TaxID=562 RepID=A0A377C020_ECOLX|nr:2-deoxy-D-gluconate 3-dehydrogenase, N-ter fragment [Escherichia coli]